MRRRYGFHGSTLGVLILAGIVGAFASACRFLVGREEWRWI